MIYDNTTTKDDYKAIFGLDLDVELGSMPNDTGEKPAARFIHLVEDFLKVQFSEPNYRWNGIVNEGNQKDCFIKAVCYQIDYIINSDELNFSGFQSDKGVVITRADIEKLGLSQYALPWMRKGGMANLTGGSLYTSLEGCVVNG